MPASFFLLLLRYFAILDYRAAALSWRHFTPPLAAFSIFSLLFDTPLSMLIFPLPIDADYADAFFASFAITLR